MQHGCLFGVYIYYVSEPYTECTILVLPAQLHFELKRTQDYSDAHTNVKVHLLKLRNLYFKFFKYVHLLLSRKNLYIMFYLLLCT